jgi:PAS domain S-box-containing protein
MLIVGISWGLDLAVNGLSWSPLSLLQLHANNPLHWLVDLFPFYLVWVRRQLAMQRGAEQRITALKREVGIARNTRAETRRVAAAIFDGLVMTDVGGRVVAVNPTAEVLFGRPGQDLQRLSIHELLPGLASASHDQKSAKRTSRHEVLAHELHISGNHAKQGRFPAAVTQAPVPIGGAVGTLYVVRDQAQERGMDSRAQDQLDAVRAARDLAVEGSRMRLIATANASHRLRTPLAAMVGYAQLLREDAQTEGSPDKVDDLVRIERTGFELLTTIDNMVDHALDEAGELELHIEHLLVHRLIRDAVSSTAGLAQSARNEVAIDLPHHRYTVQADSRRVRLILVNLLSNAHQNCSDGVIRIMASRELEYGRSDVAIEIRDNGPGMTLDQIDALSEPGGDEQPDLGLKLSRRLARRMEGSLEFDGDGGLITRLILPSSDAPSLVPHRATLRPAEHKGNDQDTSNIHLPTALLIGADNAEVNRVHAALPGHRWIVQPCTTANAMVALREKYPAIIMLGFLSPLDTWQLWAALRQNPVLAIVPTLGLDDGERLASAWNARLPCTSTDDADSLAATASRLRDAGVVPRALLVESNPDRRDHLSKALRRDGWCVGVPTNAEEAMDLAAHRPPEVMVLGSDLGDGPSMLEALAVMRGVPATRDIPTILAPGRDLSDDERTRAGRSKCLVLGPDPSGEDILTAASKGLPTAQSAPPR